MKSLPASLSKVKILPQTMRCILTLIQVKKIFYTTLKLLLVIVVDDGAGSKRTDDQLDHLKRYCRQRGRAYATEVEAECSFKIS